MPSAVASLPRGDLQFGLDAPSADFVGTPSHTGLHAEHSPMPSPSVQFGLDVQTIDFVGHAIALHQNDAYMMQPAVDTVKKIKLYYDSMMR